MKKLLTLLSIFILACQVQAAEGSRIIGARAIGMGGVSTTLQDLWSAYNNQAGLAYLTSVTAGIAYESRFSLSELSEKSIAVAIPTKSGVFGVVATSYGFADYSESKYGLSYGLKLDKNISIGLQVNYQNIRLLEPYGSKGAMSAELGIMADITEDLRLGAHIVNPFRPVLNSETNEKLASIINLGTTYDFSDKAVLGVEVDKAVNQDASLKIGLEYLFSEKLFLRAGVGTAATRSNFGIGLNFGALKFNAAVWNHQTLGLSPSLSLSYNFDPALK